MDFTDNLSQATKEAVTKFVFSCGDTPAASAWPAEHAALYRLYKANRTRGDQGSFGLPDTGGQDTPGAPGRPRGLAMELLSVGGLASVMQGKEPSCQLTVQVLGFKPLNGNPLKQRLKLWDGSSEFTQAVLDLEGREDLEVPALHSVVRLEEVRVKPAGEKWALIVQGYSLLLPGATVGRKLEASC